MALIRSYRDLEAWQCAMKMVLQTYAVAAALPHMERFGLASQMQRAAVSVPSNIAEGEMRKSPRAFMHFIAIALGSVAELDTQLEIAIRVGYTTASDVNDLCRTIESVKRLLFGLRRAQRRRLLLTGGASASMLLIVLHVLR